MSHPIKHFCTIFSHWRQVVANAWRMGIFFHALRHDLSKIGWTEFHLSAKYYAGSYSPVYKERMANHYFSRISQHHTKRNPHHWEYWTDFVNGRIVVKTMPYIWATEYVCDVLSASKTYNPAGFERDTALNYFRSRCGHYYMTEATKKYVEWCLERYAESGWKELKRKKTRAKYAAIAKEFPDVEVFGELKVEGDLPSLHA